MTQSIGIRLTDKQDKAIEQLIKQGFYISTGEFIRDAVREKLGAIRILNIRKVTRQRARNDILDYLRNHKETYASEIAIDLGLDIDLVFSILDELKREGRVE